MTLYEVTHMQIRQHTDLHCYEFCNLYHQTLHLNEWQILTRYMIGNKWKPWVLINVITEVD